MCEKIENFMNPPGAMYNTKSPYCGNPIGTFFLMVGYFSFIPVLALGAIFDKDGFYVFIVITLICIMMGLAAFLDKKIT